MGISGLYNACFGKKSACKAFLYLAKLDMDNDQLLAKYYRCATSGSKVMIRTINEPKWFTKPAKLLQLALKLTKLALRASGIDSSAFS